MIVRGLMTPQQKRRYFWALASYVVTVAAFVAATLAGWLPGVDIGGIGERSQRFVTAGLVTLLAAITFPFWIAFIVAVLRSIDRDFGDE